MTATGYENLEEDLHMLPGWESMTAYTRAKHAFAELVRRGQRIPSWMRIRELIGKGSATDIQRAIEDARQEHGEALRKMEGFGGGVPESLAPHIQGFWGAAIEVVKATFAEQEVEWHKDIKNAATALEEAQNAVSSCQLEIEKRELKIQGLQELTTSLNLQLEQERAGRVQAERMAELSHAEMNSQREQLQAELKRTQAGYDAAILRLEGIESHSLLEVERVRSDYDGQIKRITEKAQRDAMDLKITETRHENAQRELRQELNDVKQALALASQEVEHLKNIATLANEDKSRAEHRVDHLSTENSKLLQSLNDIVKKQNDALKNKK